MTAYKIAVIPGDGIGKEVMPQGIRTVDAAAARFAIELDYLNLDWACGEYYETHGTMMPEDLKAQLADMDAVLFGAVWLARHCSRSRVAMGLAVADPQGFRSVHQSAMGADV